MKHDRTIEMSTLQRIGLENLLGEQRGKREDNRVLWNIRRKLKLSQEDRRTVMQELPSGQFRFDEVAAEGIRPVIISLTDDEVRRLIKLGDSIEMQIGIMDWLEPLLVELEAKPTGVTEMTA